MPLFWEDYVLLFQGLKQTRSEEGLCFLVYLLNMFEKQAMHTAYVCLFQKKKTPKEKSLSNIYCT